MFLGINWKVRAANPMWWAQVALSVVVPLIAGMGMAWEDMTTWPTLGATLLAALQNPVIVVAMLVSLWNAVTDPTTCGFADGGHARTYDKPAE